MICRGITEIAVKDFNSMLAWYKEVLGLKEGEIFDDENGLFCSLLGSDGSECLALWEPPIDSEIIFPTMRDNQLIAPLLEVDDLYSYMDQLKKTGKVEIPGEIRVQPDYFLNTIVDPEGNELHFYQVRGEEIITEIKHNRFSETAESLTIVDEEGKGRSAGVFWGEFNFGPAEGDEIFLVPVGEIDINGQICNSKTGPCIVKDGIDIVMKAENKSIYICTFTPSE